MIDLLRDPIWQFAGAAFALVAILISLAFYLAQRRTKLLIYEVLSRAALLSKDEEIEGKFETLFQGKPVKKVHLVILRFTKRGNTPIIPADFEKSLRCIFGKNTRVLSAVVSEKSPENLEPSLTIQGNEVVFAPILLNNNDSFTVKFLLSNYDGGIKVDARIADVNGIEKREDRDTLAETAAYYLVGLAIVTIAFLAMVVTYPQQSLSIPYPELVPFSLVGLFGLAVMLFGVLKSRRVRNIVPSVLKEGVRFLLSQGKDEGASSKNEK